LQFGNFISTIFTKQQDIFNQKTAFQTPMSLKFWHQQLYFGPHMAKNRTGVFQSIQWAAITLSFTKNSSVPRHCGPDSPCRLLLLVTTASFVPKTQHNKVNSGGQSRDAPDPIF